MNAKEKVIEILSARTTEEIISLFDATEGNHDELICEVRGFLMDELEHRNPEAFSAWLDYTLVDTTASPKKFFLPEVPTSTRNGLRPVCAKSGRTDERNMEELRWTFNKTTEPNAKAAPATMSEWHGLRRLSAQ
jgi:hypothetical protein